MLRCQQVSAGGTETEGSRPPSQLLKEPSILSTPELITTSLTSLLLFSHSQSSAIPLLVMTPTVGIRSYLTQNGLIPKSPPHSHPQSPYLKTRPPHRPWGHDLGVSAEGHHQPWIGRNWGGLGGKEQGLGWGWASGGD